MYAGMRSQLLPRKPSQARRYAGPEDATEVEASLQLAIESGQVGA